MANKAAPTAAADPSKAEVAKHSKLADDVEKRQEVDPGATAVEAGPAEPGHGVDPVAREVPPPDLGGAEAQELADALAALQLGASSIIQFHASTPFVNPEHKDELKSLIDAVVKAQKGLK